MVGFLHKLGDADRRPRRQDHLAAHLLGRATGGPPTPYKADDHGEDGPTDQAPHAILHLRCRYWCHCAYLPCPEDGRTRRGGCDRSTPQELRRLVPTLSALRPLHVGCWHGRPV